MGASDIQVQAERDWAQSDSSRFHWEWHAASAAGSVAWLAAEGTIQVRAGGQDTTVPLRLTCVLEKRGDRWLLVQLHASAPASGQARGQSFPRREHAA